MDLHKLRLWCEAETAIERGTEESLHVGRIHFLGIHVNLEKVALPCCIDPDRDRVLAKRALQHCFGEIDQCEPAEKAGALEAADVERARGRQRFVVQSALVIKRRRATTLQPGIEQRCAGESAFPGSEMFQLFPRWQFCWIDVHRSVTPLRPAD